MFKSVKNIHFTGIGGIGMSGIAEILHQKGYAVTGSDANLSENTKRLTSLGIPVAQGTSLDFVNDADVLVYSSAVSLTDPELIAAGKKNIPVIKRAEMLAECMRNQYGIGICGTHGKTTTTAMTAAILLRAGLDPTVIVGGILKDLGGSNARLGKGEFIVVEADEFDRTFLSLTPSIAAITSLEAEHLDTYRDIEDLKQAFLQFANKIPFYGFIAACADEFHIKEIIPGIRRRVITYGLSDYSDVRACDIRYDRFSSSFAIDYKGNTLGTIELNVPGEHNIKNSLAAVIIAVELGVDFAVIKKALAEFQGAGRRFEIKYDKNILVIDDYAHHPTEVNSTLQGIRSGWNRRLIAVFQPHLFSRTRDFYLDFGKAFLFADMFICTDVYPAREKLIPGITGELIVTAAKELGHINAHYVADKTAIPQFLMQHKQNNDIIVTMGAGDIWQFGETFISMLESEA